MSVIYTVEDDANIRELIEYTLSSVGFSVEGFENGVDFFERVATAAPDMVILDIMLPDMDGTEILQKLRSNPSTASTAVIMLTAKSGQMDKIRGLDAGADDYITKPFDVLELISRIKAVLRRRTAVKSCSAISHRGIILDPERHIVTSDGKEIQLTYKEYEILYMLLRANGRVVLRDEIIAAVWGSSFEGESRTLDVHMRTLRQKLGAPGNCIGTIRNVGYKID